jgi:hypothetical protein
MRGLGPYSAYQLENRISDPGSAESPPHRMDSRVRVVRSASLPRQDDADRIVHLSRRRQTGPAEAPSDEIAQILSDCWPDWSRAEGNFGTSNVLASQNSPARVFLEIGAILATAFVLVLAAPLFSTL